ncbi:putative DNA helicase [Helianthus annuus]|nr:putative DNA helicase [Helianthus annuus]
MLPRRTPSKRRPISTDGDVGEPSVGHHSRRLSRLLASVAGGTSNAGTSSSQSTSGPSKKRPINTDGHVGEPSVGHHSRRLSRLLASVAGETFNAGASSSQSTSGPSKQSPISTDGHVGEPSVGHNSRRLSRLLASVAGETSNAGTLSSQSTSTSQSTCDQATPPSKYLDGGNCEYVCEYCGALFWFAERLLSTPRNQMPKYNVCCQGGAIRLPFPLEPPAAIKELFTDARFMENIRAYNNMFSMTSFGADIDDTVNDGRGPYVFKVSGQLSHWLGSLCPPDNEKPRFLQMYIYDTENEVSNRLRFFSATSQLSSDIVATISQTLASCNGYVRLFKSAIDLCTGSNAYNFAVRLYNGGNKRKYEPPAPGTLGGIIRDNNLNATTYDIVIHNKDGIAQRVSKLHSSYMPLQYPLLFPYGEQGWSPDLRLRSNVESEGKKLTMDRYYSYQIHDRHGIYALLLNGGCLFQQYLVDAYICIEQCRLEYISANQNLFRCEYLRGIHDALSMGDTEGQDVGRRTILPSSFTGGPRYMYKHYQDALAICRVHGNPQYFITFTCNTKWPEIKRHLDKIGCTHVQDRPDIIARVFQMKVEEFIKFLKSNKTFGTVAADLYTIEFQKRGLPHCHTLLWVTPPYKIREPTDVDKYITAEIPDPSVEPTLHKIVTECMMHGPCGLPNANAPCMCDGKCSKSFPKPYENNTRFDKDGYVHYKRLANGQRIVKNGVPLDNGYVVPYNKTLCKRFNAHINVEYCGWNMMIKYLFKYISKGADRVKFAVTKADDQPTNTPIQPNPPVNEIKNFVDARFICPHEAAWRILRFPIHSRNPSVQILAVHLEDMQNVTFRETMRLHTIVSNPAFGKTTLTEWLRNNQTESDGRDLRYIDYVSRYWWHLSAKAWIRRLSSKTPAIGRLVYIHPTCGELFYLRMLLCHQRGCRSFAEIRTVSGVTHMTYRAACESMGLVGNDREWEMAFVEASNWATSAEMRSLFSHMLLFCDIARPAVLWEEHWRKMSDDILLNLNRSTNQLNRCINDFDLQQYVLFEIEQLLNSSTPSASLSNYGLPMPCTALLASMRNRLLMEEKCYDRDALNAQHSQLHSLLNADQLQVYDIVMNSYERKSQTLLFVYGHGGTGKTFLWTTIISAFRSLGRIVLAVAASGIASLLLPSGRTAHSRFKIPIELTDQSVCDIKKNTQLWELLKETSLIIWDEAPMSDRRCFESLDRTLRDVLGETTKLFGGKSILLGGDFRQTLPVKPKASRSEIIDSTLPRSYLWDSFTICRLNENMRVATSTQNSQDTQAILHFASWLLSVGDGVVGQPDADDPCNAHIIQIPSKFLIHPEHNGLDSLIRFIYDDTVLTNPSAENLSDRAIVCPRNDTADQINELEYLNQLNFNGLPPHKLNLKK